jgi:hypothetical protein
LVVFGDYLAVDLDADVARAREDVDACVRVAWVGEHLLVLFEPGDIASQSSLMVSRRVSKGESS